MGTAGQRLLGAVGTVGVAAAVNAGTWVVTDHRSVAWWVSGAVLLAVGVLVQWWLPAGGGGSRRSSQVVEDVRVGGGVRLSSAGASDQVVRRARVRGDVVHESGDA